MGVTIFECLLVIKGHSATVGFV